MIRLDIELAEGDERPWAEDEADQEEWKPLSHFRSKQLFLGTFDYDRFYTMFQDCMY